MFPKHPAQRTMHPPAETVSPVRPLNSSFNGLDQGPGPDGPSISLLSTFKDVTMYKVVLVVGWLYLILAYFLSALFLSHLLALQEQAVISRLQPISISFLSSSQHHYFRLNYFRIYFL
jgi:hypothetical protein